MYKVIRTLNLNLTENISTKRISKIIYNRKKITKKENLTKKQIPKKT